MKTKTETSDKPLALHDLRELRQRLTGAPAPNDQSRATALESPEAAGGLMSATGFMHA